MRPRDNRICAWRGWIGRDQRRGREGEADGASEQGLVGGGG